MELAMIRGDFFYDLMLFLHILTAIIGFGSTFVWPYLASQSQNAGPEVSLVNSRISLTGSNVLSEYFIYAVGITGIFLVVIASEGFIEFSDTWISIALALYIVALAVSLLLHRPNLKKMLELQEEMAAGGPPPSSAGAASAGGPPPQAAELAERGRKAGMYGGILHLLFVLILADMVFKPFN